MIVKIFIVLLFLIYLSNCEYVLSHHLNYKLTKWETLHRDDFMTIDKRSKRDLKDVEDTIDKEIVFHAFERKFHLSLFPNHDIFSPNFKVELYSHNDVIKDVYFDLSTVMSGKLLGVSTSHVDILINEGLITAHIETQDDMIFIEPMWRHDSNKKNHMLIYRLSDFNKTHLSNFQKQKTSFCKAQAEDEEEMNDGKIRFDNGDKIDLNLDNHVKVRRKRQSNSNNKICFIELVADHRFLEVVGRGNHAEATSYLISHMTKVDKIFRDTNWDLNGLNYTGYRIQIEKIRVLSKRFPIKYNRDDVIEASDQLRKFAEERHPSCLAHLFTYIDFKDGLLGLAYVAEAPSPNSASGVGGGICAARQPTGKKYFNTGLTSLKNWGKTILTVEAYLVTTHEIGHNFGATHDDQSHSATECAPGQNGDGNYIMYAAAVPGTHKNNFKFSVCSKRTVKEIIDMRSNWCFKPMQTNICGNFWVEENEDCDSGRPTDKCCTKKCRFTANSSCSPTNNLCCSQSCQPSPNTKICRTHIPGLCQKDSYCDGVNVNCPPKEPVADGTECGDQGKCKNGTCQSFCTTKGLKSCWCTGKKDLCHRCCADKDGVCGPYMEGNPPISLPLPENSKCMLGYCTQGVCKNQTQDLVERVLEIISEIAPDKIGRFLADNIVGGVLVFSLIFWIPLSCFINYVDKKRMRRQKEEDDDYMSQYLHYKRRITFRDRQYSYFHPITEQALSPSSVGNNSVFGFDPNSKEEDSGAISSFSNSEKGFFPPPKFSHTQIDWSEDEMTSSLPPIACDNDVISKRAQPIPRPRPPFIRASALVVTSPSPSSSDLFLMQSATDDVTCLHRPSLHRQQATDNL